MRKRQREGRTRLPQPCLGAHGFSDTAGSQTPSQLPSSASATPKFTNLEVHRALLLDHSCLLQLLLGVHLPRLLGLQRNTWSTPSGAEQPPLPQQDQATLGDSVVTLRAHQGCATVWRQLLLWPERWHRQGTQPGMCKSHGLLLHPIPSLLMGTAKLHRAGWMHQLLSVQSRGKKKR